MKKKSIVTLSSGLAVAALASVATTAPVLADQIATDKAELGITAIDASSWRTSGKAADIDYAMYDKVNLGSLSATLWMPKRGAQGPMRDEMATQQPMPWRGLQSRLEPVGGIDTP